MFRHADKTVNHEGGLVKVIIRMPHVLDEIRERLVRALNAYELTGHADGECDALGVEAVTHGVPRCGTTIKLGYVDHVKCLAGAAVVANTLEKHGLNDVLRFGLDDCPRLM
jgi:hypothetical protein